MKLPGIKTGTINTITSDGSRRIHWRPTGELVLIASEGAAEHYNLLPRKIAANAGATEAKRLLRDSSAPLARDEARIFVGFNVKDKPTWRSGEAYLMCYLTREEQLGERKNTKAQPAFTMFYAGLGAFPGNVTVTSERSAQFVFLNFGQSKDDFFDDMLDLAQLLAESLLQESVLVEFVHDGKTFYADYIEGQNYDWTVAEAKAYLEENAYRLDPKVYNWE